MNERQIAKLAWQACEAVTANAHLGGNPIRHITEDQMLAAQKVVRAAACYVNGRGRRKLPKTFSYGGKRFYLAGSNLGRLFLGRYEGERALASGFGI